MAQGLRQGHSLAQLVQDRPRLFPSFYASLVAAGERADNLVSALEALTHYYQEKDRIKGRLLRIMFYPLLLLSVALGCGLLALWYVVPNFVHLYSSLGPAIPTATQRVFALAQAITPGRLGMAAVVMAALLALAVFVLTKLSWPLLGRLPLAGNLTCYWFCQISAMITGVGHTLEQALSMAAAVSPRGPAPVALATIRRGEPLSASLDQGPGILRSFIAQGESIGQLPQALARAAEYYRGTVELSLDNFQRYLEPVSVLVVGALVAVMLLVLMLPILQLAWMF